MHGASGDECGNLLGQKYNRPARPDVEKAPGSDFTLPYMYIYTYMYTHSLI
jgi:hypothetical protein